GQVGSKRELLVNDHDAAVLAVANAAEPAGLALEGDLTLVVAVRVDAGKHLHQGGLSGAVLPADRVDLAAEHLQVDVLQGLDPGERLGDAPHREDGVAHYPSCAWV